MAVQDDELPESGRFAAAQVELANRRLNLGEAASIGLTEGLAGFVPVLVARLGGSPFEVGLLTSIAGLVGLVLATPAASIVRRRPDIVRTYSRLRLLGYLRYGLVAVIVMTLPAQLAIPAILLTWAASAIPNTLWTVATPTVLEGIAGARGRVDLLAIRWSLMEVGSIVSSAGAGLALTALGLPVGYAIVMSGAAVLSIVAFGFARRYRFTATVRDDGISSTNPWRVARSTLGHPPFRRHVMVRILVLGGLDAMGLLVTLLLVNVLRLQDSDIGLLLAAQRIGTIAGYLAWRRIDARRGPRGILLLAVATAAPYPIALALAPPLLLLAAVLAWAGVAASGISLGLWDESMLVIPPDRRLAFVGVLYTIDYAILLAVPILAAGVAQVAGIPAALVVSGATLGLGAIAIRLQRRTAA